MKNIFLGVSNEKEINRIDKRAWNYSLHMEKTKLTGKAVGIEVAV